MNRRKIIGHRLPRPNALKLGDVAAIPLSNGSYGYGRRYHGAALGVLNITSDTILPLKLLMTQQVAFFVLFCEPIDHPDWIYVGKWKFDDDDDAWGPAWFIHDRFNPTVFSICERGKMRSATKEETIGLSDCTLLFPKHVRERIEAYFACNGI